MSVITGTNSIIAVKYDHGVIIVSDKVINYGSSFKYANVSHIFNLTPNTIITGSGEFSDLQELVTNMESRVRDYRCSSGGNYLTPLEIHTYVKRIMYNRRSKFNPIALKCLVAGVEPDGNAFLGVTDLYGTSWTDNVITTGYAMHLQGTQLVDAAGKNKRTVMEAISAILQTLLARHAFANPKFEVVDITVHGITRSELSNIQPNWEFIP